MSKFGRSLWWVIAALVVVVTALAPSSEAGGQRLVVQLDEPFEIDGQLYAPARLSLRQVQAMNPVSSLYEACVDRSCRGMLVAYDTGIESARDEVIFTRGEDGQLVLVGVAFEGQPARELSAVGLRASRGNAAATATAQTAAEPAVMVAQTR